MRPASMAGSRRSKIEALREREALKVRARAPTAARALAA